MARAASRVSSTARERALDLLGRRLLSEHELRLRLGKAGYAQAAIDDAVSLVRSYGYLNDLHIAQAVEREATRSLRGPGWVIATLERRGVGGARAQAAAEAIASQSRVLAQQALAKRFGGFRQPTLADRQRAFRFLVGRGFPPDTVMDLLGGDQCTT